MVGGPDYRIYQVTVKWPGSIGDAHILDRSPVPALYTDSTSDTVMQQANTANQLTSCTHAAQPFDILHLLFVYCLQGPEEPFLATLDIHADLTC